MQSPTKFVPNQSEMTTPSSPTRPKSSCHHDETFPVDNSRKAAQTLRAFGIEVLELYPPGTRHGFDLIYEVS